MAEAEESLIAAAEPAPDTPDQATGVEESAERPEWLAEKFKTVEDQAKAYKELESKFGGFTGAPADDYELTLPEGTTGAYDLEDPRMKWFQAAARDSGMSQDTFTQMLHGYVQAELSQRPDPAAEIQAMGPDAQSRLKNLADWGKSHLTPDEFQGYQGLITTAAQADALEKVLAHTREVRMSRGEETKPVETTTDDLRAMRHAKDEFGNPKMNDPTYRKKVDQAYRDLLGDGPASQVVG